MLSSEDEYGNIEYKLKIIPKSEYRFEQLATQLKWRLSEGNGEAFYYIGIYDNGKIANISNGIFEETIKNIKNICNEVNASIRNIETIIENNKKWYKILIKSNIEKILDYRIMFIGPTQVGKSTLISNIINNEIDNGKGKTRKLIFNHKHEILSGITSSITIEKLKINNIVYNLIDTPGKNKYLKTTICALTKYKPNLVFLCLNSNNLKDIKFFYNLIKFFEIKFKIFFINNKKNKILNLKLNKYNKKNYIQYIEVDNLVGDYKKVISIIKKVKPIIKKNNIFDTCNIIKIPNFGTILVGLLLDKINIKDKYYLSSSEYLNKEINCNSIYYLDKSVNRLKGNKLISIKLNENIFNRTDIILSNKKIFCCKKILVECDNQIKNNQGLCIFNNQYLLVNIKKIDKYYELNSTNYFINLSDKILLKINNNYYFCRRII